MQRAKGEKEEMSRTPTIPNQRPYIEELLDPQIGDLVKLYNLYMEIVIERPAIIGLYMGKGHSGRFSYYKINVIRDAEDRGFFISDAPSKKQQRYITNDYLLCKCS